MQGQHAGTGGRLGLPATFLGLSMLPPPTNALGSALGQHLAHVWRIDRCSGIGLRHGRAAKCSLR